MSRFDAWLGRNVFQPPIIFLCQRTGMSQYAIHRYLWWGVALQWVATASDAVWGWQAVLVAFALCRTVSAGVLPDDPKDGSRWLRLIFMAFLPLDVISLMAGGSLTDVFETIAILFAEYALTIRTIPPREIEAKKPARVDARA